MYKRQSGDYRGEQGIQGNPGKSAYEVAIENGFTGTEQAVSYTHLDVYKRQF